MKKKIIDNRKMIYFTLICISIVVVVTTGTYAYFTAKKTVENAIGGQTATVSFGLAVKKISTIDYKGLIPMDDELAPFAVKTMCEDEYTNAVCQIYQITITNTGNTNMYLDGYMTLNMVTDDEMRFTRVYYDGDTFCISENCQNETDLSKIRTGVAVNTDGKFNRQDDVNALLATGENENPDDLIIAGQEKIYYAMVWIHNENEEQNDLQGVINAFNGKVTFISSQGNEVTAVF